MKKELSNVPQEKKIKMALDKNQIAQRIAKEVKDGYYVNLGIGIPTLVANYVRTDISVEFQSENGVLGMGPFPFEGEEDADDCENGDRGDNDVFDDDDDDDDGENEYNPR